MRASAIGFGLAAVLAASGARAESALGTVSGQALDSLGRPLAGTRIWIRPALTCGLLQTRTDAEGRYRVTALVRRIPYRAYAWHNFGAGEKQVCVRLGFDNPADYDAFVPETDVVRNFKLKHEGRIDDYEGQVFGGELRVFIDEFPEGVRLELNFKPEGALVDGASAKPVTRTFDPRQEALVYGIPLAAYRVSARAIGAGETPLAISSTSSSEAFGAEARLTWESGDSCIGSSASGPPRKFLWVRPRHR